MAMGGLLGNWFGQQQGQGGAPLPAPPGAMAQAPGAAMAATQQQGILGQLGETFNQMREENPEFLTGIGIGLMKGDVAGGMEWAAQQRQGRLADERRYDMQERGWDRDDARFEKTFGLQQAEFDMNRQALGTERAQALAQQNQTYAWGDSTGDPDVIALVRANRFSEAFQLHKAKLERVGEGAYGAAPSGFMYDPADPSRLTPIPGGPGEQISGENAGRIGIAEAFLSDLPSIREEVSKGGVTGIYDANMGRAGLGEQGRVYARIESGADALQRMLSGAGMPDAEAAAYARRYMPRPADSAEIVQSKLAQLERELTSQMEVVGRGRGGARRAQAPLDPPAGGMQEIDGVRIRRID